MNRNNRKRDLYIPSIPEPSIQLVADPVLDKNSSDAKQQGDVNVVDNDTILKYIESLSSSSQVKTTSNVYFKIAIGIPESRYFEDNIEDIQQILRTNFDTTLTISETVPGVIEKFITINGKVNGLIKTALYVAYLVRKLNNIGDTPLTVKSDLSISFYINKLDKYTLRQIELRSKPLRYFEAFLPTYYSPLGHSILSIDVEGSIDELFNFLHIIDVWPNKFQYIEDTHILQIPIVYADDTNLYKTQEVNKGLLKESIDDTLKRIFQKI